MTLSRLRWCAIAAAFVSAACSSDPTGAGDVLVVAEVEIDPPGAGLIVGATQQLSATPKTASGIPVPNRSVTWSSSDPAIATVSGSGMVTAVSLGEAGISARVDGVSESVPVNVSPKPVAQVVLEPATVTIQAGQTRQLTVTVKAADGQTLEDRTVDFESDDPAIATVSSTGLVTAISAGQTTIRAISEGREAGASVTVTPRPAVRLAFTTQPANGIAGNPLSDIKVALQDAVGATVANATNAVTISLEANPSNATLTGDLKVNAVAGVATFTDLELNRPGTGYRFRVTSGELTAAVSNSFAIVSGPPASLAIATQPSATATSGAPFPRQPVVQLRDDEGNNASQPGVEITASLVGSGGTLGGTTTIATDAGGAARFTNLTISGGAGQYQLRFSAPDLPATTSETITVAPAAIAIATQPSATASSGIAFPQQPAVRLTDLNGDPVAQSGVTITVALAGSSATLSGDNTAATNSSGVATFSGLAITGTPGQYRLVFTAAGVPSVTSDPIDLGPGAPDELRVVVQPSDVAVSALPFLVQPEVQLVDNLGTPVPLAGVAVTASIGSGGGTLGGTLTVETNSEGRAEFTDLRITGSGNHTLKFNATGLTEAESEAIDVILSAGSDELAIAVQPSPTGRNGKVLERQPAIQLRNTSSGDIARSGLRVVASLVGDGKLDGNLERVTDDTGRAQFTNLRIIGMGGFRIRFSATELPAVESDLIQIQHDG